MTSVDNLSHNAIYQVRNGIQKEWTSGMYVRKFAPIELMYAGSMKYHSDNTVQAIWLKSKTVIDPDRVEDAVQILARKYPNLQLCVGKKNGTFWFRVMETINVDFDFCVQDPMEAFHEMLATKLDFKNGPMWKARLVFSEDNHNDCSAVFILCAHHSITDAWTNTLYCKEIVRILNGDSIPLAPVPLSTRVCKDNKIPAKSLMSFYSKYVGGKVKHFFVHSLPPSYVFKNLTLSKSEEAKTKVISNSFSEDDTKNIFKACKEHKITVNSFIVAISNLALVESVNQKKRTKHKNEEIIVAQIADMRRYYDLDSKDVLGCHIGVLETRHKTPFGKLDEFWKYAAELHSSTKKKLDKKAPIKVSNFLPAYKTVFQINKKLTDHGLPNISDYHYCSTNMGNMSNLLDDERESDSVTIDHVLRATNREFGGIFFNLTFQTFKNKLLISLDYYTNKIPKEDIERYNFLLMKFITDIANGEPLALP